MKRYYFVSFLYGQGGLGAGNIFLQINDYLVMTTVVAHIQKTCNIAKVTVMSYQEITQQEFEANNKQ